MKYENEKLLEKISKWEAPDGEGNIEARSPANLTRIIGDLQATQLELTGRHVQLKTKVRASSRVFVCYHNSEV